MNADQKGDTLDLAIVGAGISGLYCAWRLVKSQETTALGINPSSIGLFEASPRVGGRLLSVPMPGMAIPAELGGMRYTSGHLLFSRLVDLCPWTSPLQFEYPTRQMYLRGRHLKFGQCSTPRCSSCDGELPYKFRDGEMADCLLLVKKAFAQALRSLRFPSKFAKSDSINKKLRDLDESGSDLKKSSFSAAEWEHIRRRGELRDGGSRPLYELGFWNMLHHYLSSEAFLFLHDALGYESIFVNWNAAEAIPWFLGDFDAEYHTLPAGMDRVPQWLALEMAGAGVRIERNHVLREVHVGEARNDVMTLTLDRLDKKSGKIVRLQCKARHVVLALPKGALEQIEFQWGAGRREKEVAALREDLASVTAHPLFKLFLAYPRPWWKADAGLGAGTGRVTTDLPIRQVYYFGQGPGREVEDGERALLMASYSDAQYVGFWTPVEKIKGTDPYFRGRRSKLSKKEKVILDAWGVSRRMVLKAHGQVAALHPELRDAGGIPEPYVGVVQNWGTEPFYGGWHSWNVRTRPWDIVRRLAKPINDVNLYICGEAYSREQGWVEGALKSGELVLNKLGLGELKGIKNSDYRQVAGCTNYKEYIRS